MAKSEQDRLAVAQPVASTEGKSVKTFNAKVAKEKMKQRTQRKARAIEIEDRQKLSFASFLFPLRLCG